MRVTMGMINRRNSEAARKGMAWRSGTQQNRTGGMERLESLGAARGNTALKRTQRIGYESMGSKADQLVSAAEQLGRKADGGEDCVREVQSFLDAYNSTLDTLDSASGVLNRYYQQMMKQTYSDQRKELEELGIAYNSSGKLTLNQEKLKGADPEQVKRLLGTEGDFVKRASYVASRVSDNAKTNVQNLSTAYNARGDIMNSYLSRYNLLG
ncbi:MAG: hypothetical protein NC432_07480 [Roseburia sp.]|nr:hypothetical protein [Roseburia sp.]MCM1098560.1 hypothetical protein [Ruminococcus flavefaciens]